MSAAKCEPYFVRESPSGGKPVSDGFRLRNGTKRSASRRAEVAWSRAEK